MNHFGRREKSKEKRKEMMMAWTRMIALSVMRHGLIGLLMNWGWDMKKQVLSFPSLHHFQSVLMEF